MDKRNNSGLLSLFTYQKINSVKMQFLYNLNVFIIYAVQDITIERMLQIVVRKSIFQV